ncbi:Mut7-C ubiquitin/RNAse domain-containing protein [Nocardia sp. NEAU-G5]|uniref:Mut7-C ubiquitin/RNAse domain-containing protein n=1 Tax=Nocardia albiluteola TaxID=2842303 RepID=A0ABS6B7R9_9NOCA|nr:Mut7-C ubiquitin/RNAse domain-containing protein [Nocardia albiluteola]MBU3065441.1 Mut7-C ubiquitin/RNAse domain-containing protein [Nocardia albiluteola]
MTSSVELRVYAELNDFVPVAARYAAQLRPIRPHQTVKDIVEAAGIPHTEVDLLLVNGESVDFGHRPRPGDRLAAYPVFETLDIGPLTRVRARPLRDPRFVVDVNLGGLGRLMRLMGLDARGPADADDTALAAAAAAERRIILTRDHGLLKRRTVTHGVFVRSDRPFEQIVEVIRRLDLADRLLPFSRCMRCGGVLADVAKQDVVDRLEPLTRDYYDTFRQCRECSWIYWEGSHQQRLNDLVTRIRDAIGPQ